MEKHNEQLLRKLPSVDVLLKDSELERYFAKLGRKVVADSVRRAVENVREILLAGKPPEIDESTIYQKIITDVKQLLEAMMRPYYRRVINATGIILHTGLGRAVIPSQALQQIQGELSGYSLLQTDPETGKRSKREARIEQLLQQLTGAEAATVVNNNAAATSIVLNTIAEGKEVIVSRGQLVEIGGSFRLPDVMAFSGAKLVEVGATNKTHPRDYVNAITENTAAILRVHPSNYKIQGFSSEVPPDELVERRDDHTSRIYVEPVHGISDPVSGECLCLSLEDVPGDIQQFHRSISHGTNSSPRGRGSASGQTRSGPTGTHGAGPGRRRTLRCRRRKGKRVMTSSKSPALAAASAECTLVSTARSEGASPTSK